MNDMSKYFVVAGTYDQFKDFKIKKMAELWNSGNRVEHTDFIYVTEETLRGYSEPHGWFIGTWRERSDIKRIMMLLRIAQRGINPTLDRLHAEVD
jgi:hypothetical protein